MNDISSSDGACSDLSHYHCGLIFEDLREQLAACICFIREGLQRGEKCIWALARGHRNRVLKLLRATQIDVDGALRSGALELPLRAEVGRQLGQSSDARAPIGVLRRMCRAALAQGFSGLRVTGEVFPSDAVGGGLPLLLGHESRLSAFLADRRCSVLCQYSRRRFPAEMLLGVIRTHRLILHQGEVYRNYYYVPPDDFLRPGKARRDVGWLLEQIRTRTQIEAARRRARGRLGALVRARTGELEQANWALQKSETALRGTGEQVRELARSLLAAQEEERKRLSRELHDDFSQKLAMLSVEVQTLVQQPELGGQGVREQLSRLRERLDALADDSLRMAHQLHPSILEHLGLEAALRAFGQEVALHYGIRVRFIGGGLPAGVSAEAALCLYRVAQEALHNVAKHSRSPGATLKLSASRTAVHLQVTDRGVGFEPESVRHRGSLGIVSMEERVRLLGGDFSVRSRPGKGVRLEVRIPLAPESP